MFGWLVLIFVREKYGWLVLVAGADFV